MNSTESDWQLRIDAVWAEMDSLSPEKLVEKIDAIAAERSPNNAVALFERAGARDSGGFEREAEPLYRAALADEKLDANRRAQATIQLGSPLRLLGRLDESEALLVAELERHMLPGNPRALHDEARAILALTYLAQGRAKEAAGLALTVLGPHLSLYKRSIKGNAAEMVSQTWE